jgi:hypothetical protein
MLLRRIRQRANDSWALSSNLLVVASVLGPSLAFLEDTLITGYG